MGKVRVPLAWLACAALAGNALADEGRLGDAAPPVRGGLSEPAPAPATGAGLDLATALHRAEARSPDMAASQLEAEATRHELAQAGVRPNPELGVDVEDANRRQRTTTVLLSQRMELGGKRDARVQAARKASELATVQTQQQRVETRAAVTRAFFDTLIAQERVQLAQEALNLAQLGAAVADKRVQAGKVSPVELTRARVAQAQTRMALTQAQGELQTSLHALHAALGGDTRVERVEGKLLQVPTLPALPAVLDTAERAPARRKSALDVERWSAVAAVERSLRTPDVTLSVGIKRERESARNQVMLGVSMPLPLFDRNQDNELAALRRRDKAEEEARALALRQRADLLSAHQRWASATEVVALMRQDVLPGAESAYAAATRGFSLGKFSYLEALDAQRALLEAKTQYLTALADAYRAASDVERLIGEPLFGTAAPSTTTPK
ncbi:hypothetical protein CCO03_04875 [Comamonas serinivorans]|uniref:Cobalt-zinc-cadmium resistance protein n=1 Tax=Comamonas serinivorans TaxID=1082851 RepID=A0A1Y0EKI1_9BURK|nr:TolC family protein [Comamonas serinivorans]ARU04097.1 hypothetical protein CCO03_04875 [Comamonas serinivorans]